MVPSDAKPLSLSQPKLWEWQLVALAVITAAIYGSRLTDLPIRGEETRRAEVATEMLRTGDWIVPRQQLEPFLSRPPLGSYPIAGLMWLSGGPTLWTVRLPSVLATWLTTLLIYGYGRRFMTPLGALASGLAFATMGMVLQLGRLAESEATFTLLLSAALLIWHWGYSRKWPGAWAWVAGYSLAALAALVKGPQAPAYFGAAVALYLIRQGQWRALFNWRHVVGLIAFVLVVGAWQAPFASRMGWPAVQAIWLGDVGLRFEDTRWQTIALHALLYPVGVLVATLPWSPLLSAYFSRGFRRSIADVAPLVNFLSIAIAVSGATCWLTPGAKERYMMPVFPCLALLAGLVFERALEPAAGTLLRRGWRVFATLFGAAAVASGLSIAGATWIGALRVTALAESNSFAALFLSVAIASGSVMITSGLATSWKGRGYGLLAGSVAFVGVFFIVLVINGMVRLSEEAGPAIAQLKEKLPANTRLVSFGMVETLFTYYYQDPVELQKWPAAPQDLDPKFDYFCFTWDRETLPELPFAWQVEGEISCDRQHQQRAVKRVIVGKRVDAALAAAEPRKFDPSVRPAAFESPVAAAAGPKSAAPKRMFDPSLRQASFRSPEPVGKDPPQQK